MLWSCAASRRGQSLGWRGICVLRFYASQVKGGKGVSEGTGLGVRGEVDVLLPDLFHSPFSEFGHVEASDGIAIVCSRMKVGLILHEVEFAIELGKELLLVIFVLFVFVVRVGAAVGRRRFDEC